MTVELLSLYAYNEWANESVIRMLRALPEDAVTVLPVATDMVRRGIEEHGLQATPR